MCAGNQHYVQEIRNVYKIFIRNPEIKSKYRQEDLNEFEKVIDWIELAQETDNWHSLVNVVLNLLVI